MQSLQYSDGVVGSALGAAAGLGRWFAGLAVLPVYGDFQRRKQHSATTEPCHFVSGQPWVCHGVLQGQIQPLVYGACGVEPALGAAAGVLGRCFVGVAVLLVCGAVQRRQQHSATTARRALPVCEFTALVMPQGTASLNTASAVCSSCYEASCT